MSWVSYENNFENMIQLNISFNTVKELDRNTKKFIIDIHQAIWENMKPMQRKTAGNNYETKIRDIVSQKGT